MAPALLVDVGFEAVWHPRRGAVIRHIAGRAGHAGTAAITAVRPVPRSQGMVLADPADVRTEDAFHANSSAPVWVNFTKVPDRSNSSQPLAIA
jgi:hypothetical protein